MRGSVIVISGIDSGVGKTVATGLLAKALLDQGSSVTTQKLVQTGCAAPVAEDIAEHRRIMGIGLTEEDLNDQSAPYVFRYPASPHLAAALENMSIDIMTVRRTTFRLQRLYDTVLLEGAGGLLVPLESDLLFADYVRDAGYPLILVSSSRLGGINHTLLSVEACLSRGIVLRGIIFNRYKERDRIVADDALETIRRTLKRYGLASPVVTLDEKGFAADTLELLGLTNPSSRRQHVYRP